MVTSTILTEGLCRSARRYGESEGDLHARVWPLRRVRHSEHGLTDVAAMYSCVTCLSHDRESNLDTAHREMVLSR